MANFCEDLFDAFDEQPDEIFPDGIKRTADNDTRAATSNANIKRL